MWRVQRIAQPVARGEALQPVARYLQLVARQRIAQPVARGEALQPVAPRYLQLHASLDADAARTM